MFQPSGVKHIKQDNASPYWLFLRVVMEKWRRLCQFRRLLLEDPREVSCGRQCTILKQRNNFFLLFLLMFGWLIPRRIHNNFVCDEIQNLTKNTLQVEILFTNYCL